MLPVQDKQSVELLSHWSGAYGARVTGEVCMSFICAVQVASAVYVSECQDAGMQEEMKLCDKIEQCNC